MVCESCGKPIDGKNYGRFCQGCYIYFRNGGTINPIPEIGRIVRDARGYVVCHLCGKSYKRLGSHIRESHQLTIDEYKETFGLCRCSKTTESAYSLKMRENAYKNGMPQRLIIAGKNTRIQAGQTDKRKGKKTRLEEQLNKSARRRGC